MTTNVTSEWKYVTSMITLIHPIYIHIDIYTVVEICLYVCEGIC